MTQELSTFLQCPHCEKYGKAKVLDCRRQEETNRIRRRRMCTNCMGRFTTYESIEGVDRISAKKVKSVIKQVHALLQRLEQ